MWTGDVHLSPAVDPARQAGSRRPHGAQLALLASPAISAQPFPDLIELPANFGPEGIAIGNGTTFYAGSLAAATRGQILVGDVRTDEFATLVEPDGVPATGMKHDPRSNLLFVARAGSGMATIFDAASGDVVVSYQLRSSPTFINDVVITRDAAYFTDTQAPFLYRVDLGRAGEPSATATEIPLPAVFRTNGIAATPNGHYLFVVSASQLYRVDTLTYTPVPVDLGGTTLPNADGLLLDGKTLYVVQNQLNRVAVVDLSSDYLTGEVVRYITEPFASNAATRVPTTIAEFGNALYAVTAGFAAPTPDYVVRLSK